MNLFKKVTAGGPGPLLHGADYNYEQWLDRPDILDADFAAMKESGCNVMAVGIFSWSMYEAVEGQYDFSWMDTLLDRLEAAGMKAILASPSGSKPAWMSMAYPEVCRVGVNGIRETHGGRHNHCRSSPIYREKTRAINTLLAKRYKNHPALILWHVSNEYNASRCYCEHCLGAFRDWLKERYGDLDSLNKAWWSTFWSHRITDWNQIYPADSSMNGMMLDWARFTSDQSLDFYLAESKPFREITPNIPITTNFMMPDVGLDYYHWAKHVDIVSWDNYPRWHTDGNDPAIAVKTAFYHDFFRSLKGKPFLLMESTPSNTNWQGVSPLKRPGMHQLASLQAIAHGSDSVQYFQWRQSRGGEEKFHGAVMTHFNSTSTRTFQDVKAVGEALLKLGKFQGSQSKNEVALVYDFHSAWALDMAQLPMSLSKRYQDECIAHYEAFWKQGIGVDIIDGSCQDLKAYKIVVAPMLYLIQGGFAEGLETFVQGGGTLVLTYLSALVNESDLCFLGGAPGPLAKIAGLRVEETDALPEGQNQTINVKLPGSESKTYQVRHYADNIHLEGAQPWAWYGSDFLAGKPALTVNTFGAGKVWYQAARSTGEFLGDFYRNLAYQEKLTRAIPWALPPGISAVKRGEGADEAIFVMNFNPFAVELDLGNWQATNILDGTNWTKCVKMDAYSTGVLKQVY